MFALSAAVCLLQSFEEFVNKQGRSPEYVSLYIDELLRNKKQEISDADVELKMDKVMPLFRSVGQSTKFIGCTGRMQEPPCRGWSLWQRVGAGLDSQAQALARVGRYGSSVQDPASEQLSCVQIWGRGIARRRLTCAVRLSWLAVQVPA
jgi:hypothetical protein